MFLQVIQLLRDPRGVVTSQSEGEYLRTNMWSCHDVTEDAKYMARMQYNPQITGSYLRIRYEDLVRSPAYIIDRMYRFIGVTPDATVRNWLKEFIGMKEGIGRKLKRERGVGTLRKDPKAIPARWKEVLSQEQIRQIEQKCYLYMKMFGYPFHSIEE